MKIKFSLTLVASLLISQSAVAQMFSTPFQAGSQATLTLSGGRSYNCYVDDSGDYTLSLDVLSPTGQVVSAIYPDAQQQELEARVSSSKNFGDTNLTNNVISFITPLGSANFGEYKITMAATTMGSNTPYVYCIETGSTCNFNTFLNDFGFLEITNTGSKTAPVTYMSVDFQGNSVQRSIDVPAGRRIDVDIHTMVGSSKYGTITILPKIASLFNEGIRVRLSHYKADVLTNTEVCSPFSPIFGFV